MYVCCVRCVPYLGELLFKDGLALTGGGEFVTDFDKLAGHGGFRLELDAILLNELCHVVLGLHKLQMR